MTVTPREPDTDELLVVLSTAPDLEVGRKIARGLVESRAAACVNVIPGATSIYRWKGAVEEASEVVLVMKTTAARLAALEHALRALHPYEVPEFVAVDVAHVEPRYCAWVIAETR